MLSERCDKLDILKRYFGYSSFRNGQDKAIDFLLARQDVVGVMPTGAGKSLCYQVPALMLDGLTLVISPLISLMVDQVTRLNSRGVPSAFINTTLSPAEYSAVLKNIKSSVYKLVYVAPERLLSAEFVSLCRELNIAMIAVDEAHCISQWGHDFRPSYLSIDRFVDLLPKRPIIGAFTATATPAVVKDIALHLNLNTPQMIKIGFDRPNLTFSVIQDGSKTINLEKLLVTREDKSGIIYCITRKQVDKVYAELLENGYSVTRYHAGLDEQERAKNQYAFVTDRVRIMVATNAFGMGIDKPNISFVIHYSMPKTLENYYQEAGRAGRNGELASCILLFSAGDIHTNRMMIDDMLTRCSLNEREKLKELEYSKLGTMASYCSHTGCLRSYILEYFGDSGMEDCKSCANCVGDYKSVDLTAQAKLILGCIAKIGQKHSLDTVADILRGIYNESIPIKKLNRLESFGVLKKYSKRQILFIVNLLISRGYLTFGGKNSSALVFTPISKKILKDKVTLSIKMFSSDRISFGNCEAQC